MTLNVTSVTVEMPIMLHKRNERTIFRKLLKSLLDQSKFNVCALGKMVISFYFRKITILPRAHTFNLFWSNRDFRKMVQGVFFKVTK